MLEKLFRRVVGINSMTDPTKKGPVRIVDGDDLEWDGVRYRLDGFDAPEMSPSNLRSRIDKGLERERGLKARRQLREHIEAASVIDLVPLNRRLFRPENWPACF